ncbi:YdeI/OmpD-associated family protein [Massilia aurea]|uniref:YdeI/OmpD-associated family protein n=1 Tax=Massilia aurea TaxID=373040 RepID=UPI003462D2F9
MKASRDQCQYGLRCYVSDLELYWAMRFTLHHDRTVHDATSLCDVANLSTQQVAAAELSIDCQVEESKIPGFLSQLAADPYPHISFNVNGVFWPTCLALFEVKADGRWDAAYPSPSTISIPCEILAAFENQPIAAARFHALPKAQRYLLHPAIVTKKKTETRVRKAKELADRLSAEAAVND